jgi:hypothetical protein
MLRVSSIQEISDFQERFSGDIGPQPPFAPEANSKPPSTKPTTPSKTSSNCSKLPEFVEVFLFTGQCQVL